MFISQEAEETSFSGQVEDIKNSSRCASVSYLQFNYFTFAMSILNTIISSSTVQPLGTKILCLPFSCKFIMNIVKNGTFPKKFINIVDNNSVLATWGQIKI